MTDDPTARLKALATEAHELYGLALRIARAHWPKDTPPEVLASATHTLFISLRDQESTSRRREVGNYPGPAVAPPDCELCGRIMLAVVKTNPKMPDYRCPDPSCDHAVWLGKKVRGAGAR